MFFSVNSLVFVSLHLWWDTTDYKQSFFFCSRIFEQKNNKKKLNGLSHASYLHLNPPAYWSVCSVHSILAHCLVLRKRGTASSLGGRGTNTRGAGTSCLANPSSRLLLLAPVSLHFIDYCFPILVPRAHDPFGLRQGIETSGRTGRGQVTRKHNSCPFL